MKDEGDSSEVVAFVAAGAAVLVGLACVVFARRAHATAVDARTLHVPYASDALELNGELSEPSWRASARSGPFVLADGKEATPYSDARFSWDDRTLRVGLYAADQDIVAAKVPADGRVLDGDAFHVVITTRGVEHVLDVGPTCILADGERRASGSIDWAWQSDTKLACDSDGTVNVPGDYDEEWVVEMRVPLAKLGLSGHAGERASIRIRRCEVGTGGRVDPAPCGDYAATTLVFDR